VSQPDSIHLKGAREHNLRNIELRIPRGQLVVITGVSGSGKSSLAFDTLYAEGYRKYIDSLSTKARQILEQVKRPEVDFIDGLSPVIAIEQRAAAGANPRSTVATVSEVADYARLLWAVCGIPRCPLDGGRIERRSLDDCVDRALAEPTGSRAMVIAPVMVARPALLREEIPRLQQRGYQRVRIGGRVRALDEPDLIDSKAGEESLDVVVDRLVLEPSQRSRLADSLELAFREGKDRAVILVEGRGTAEPPGGRSEWREVVLSQHLSCAICGTVYEPISPKSFSYNHPEGACPDCGGLGETRQFSDSLLVPDSEKTVRGGAIKPWRLGSKRMIIRRNAILKQLAEQLPFDPLTPWKELSREVRQTILHGAGDRIFSFKLTGGNRKGELMPFPGVIADLDTTRRETSSDGLKARLMAYQTSKVCPGCAGWRLRPESLAVGLENKGFSEFMEMTIESALAFVHTLSGGKGRLAITGDALTGLEKRLFFLREVGLGYLSLDRHYRTLSGGESQRVRLATQLGMGLVGVVYVLDEPTIGLHPADNRRLLQTLLELRDRGNAVIVVEHDEATIRAADYLIELGPGAGSAGGEVIFAGTPLDAAGDANSITGHYLSGRNSVRRSAEERRPDGRWLRIKGASCHNLKSIDGAFPVGLLTCVTGVSGSGKSSLVNDTLAAAAAFKLNRAKSIPGQHGGIDGLQFFQTVVRVDQSPIGRSPRSNPATYIKLFDLLRTLYSKVPLARVRGYKPSRFSFNVRGGRCERCRGDGVIRLDMQFLADVYAECPSCFGRRYNRETLEVRYKGYSIAEILDLSVGEAGRVFRNHPRIMDKLTTLEAVGLGYLKLGQASNTLSGGEAQRIKLSLELSRRQQGETLYLLDEPTTGLHWSDIQNLLDLLFRLRDAGNTVIVIEHQLDVIGHADWIIDLGPEGGDKGGKILFEGAPEDILKSPLGHTARALEAHFTNRNRQRESHNSGGR